MILTPGGAWRRLYSAFSSMRQTRLIVARSWPLSGNLLDAQFVLDQAFQNLVQVVVGRQGVLVGLVGLELGRVGALVMIRFRVSTRPAGPSAHRAAVA